MSLLLIRAEVASILGAVSGVENVYEYQRWANTWETFLSYFKHKPTQKINGWEITRKKTPTVTSSVTHDTRTHTFLIRGIYGLKDSDESELVFQALIEAVCAAFRSKYQLNDTADNTEPVQVLLVENRMFGTVLCHYCELELTADEYENWS